MTVRKLLLACATLMPLTMALGANPAYGANTFGVRISIIAQCTAQQPLFGPAAQGTPDINCDSSTTPFQARQFSPSSFVSAAPVTGTTVSAATNTNSTDSTDSTDATDATDATDSTDSAAGGQSGGQSRLAGVDATSFSPSSKKLLSPALPTGSTFVSKVVYVVF